MMDEKFIEVFVSSTSADLIQDCRPDAIKAIQECKAIPITMESWDADYRSAIQVCRQKLLEESSHYLGIFAYRRGWTPAELGKSITEAEFDWAYEAQKQMAVLVPQPETRFALELRKRAKDQSDDEKKAQLAILKRLSSMGAYMPFADLSELNRKVVRKVLGWQTGGIRAMSRAVVASPPPSSPPASSPPSSSLAEAPQQDLASLGREEQIWQVTTIFQLLKSRGLPGVGCFLIHGASGYGHKELATRIVQSFKSVNNRPVPRVYQAPVGIPWRSNTLARLIEVIALQIRQNEKPIDPGRLADQLQILLEANPVILEISDLQRFDGGLPAFIEKFWQPFAAAFQQRPRYRLLVLLLLELEQKLPLQWNALLNQPDLPPGTPFDLAKPVKLTELSNFTLDELTAWLQNWLKTDDATSLAKTLITETAGRPYLLFPKLLDDAIWALP